MEGKRVVASPQPCNGRRVVAAKRQRVDASANCMRKLQRREIGTSGNRAFNITNSQEKFRNFQLQEEFDTYDTKAHWFLKLQFLKKRTNGYAELMAKSSVSSIINSERNYLSNGAGLGEGTNL